METVRQVPEPRQAPTLDELPPPPADRIGWPWTDASPASPTTLPDGRPWPRITVVTPSYNQAEFLEATLRSVLLQGYPNLEYIVIDGGSQDGSVEILQRYAPWLAYWTSEPDRGQSHAINKGFARSTGEIQAWLNSDDTYYPGALARVARTMATRPCDILIGAMDKVEVGPGYERLVKTSTPDQGTPLHPIAIFANGRRADFHFIQPPMFWRAELWAKTDGLDERYHYAMDTEWCSRAIVAGARVDTTSDVLARFVLHHGSKSQDFHHRQLEERALMYLRLARRPGFRPVRCIMASLRPTRRALALRARRRSQQGHRVQALLLRLGSRAVGVLDYGAGRVVGPGSRSVERI